MLVLTRKPGQIVYIGDNYTVCYLRPSGTHGAIDIRINGSRELTILPGEKATIANEISAMNCGAPDQFSASIRLGILAPNHVKILREEAKKTKRKLKWVD